MRVCRFSPFSGEHGLIGEFTLRNERGLVLTDSMRAVFVSLPVVSKILKKPVSDMTAAEMWAVFIAKSDKLKYIGLINEIARRREAIAAAQREAEA